MTKQEEIREEIREGIAKNLLELVVKCETRLIHTLSPKIQKLIGHEPYTWETIPEDFKFFWLEEADKIMRDEDSQGVVLKGQSLGGSHPHLANYFTVVPLIKEKGVRE